MKTTSILCGIVGIGLAFGVACSDGEDGDNKKPGHVPGGVNGATTGSGGSDTDSGATGGTGGTDASGGTGGGAGDNAAGAGN